MYKKIACLLLFIGLIHGLYAAPKAGNPFKRGAGSFEYTDYEPMHEHPVIVFYYIPTRGNIKKMRVLISMHGAERNGLVQRGVWRDLAEEYGFIVLAPQFTHQNGYQENEYQFGGVSKSPRRFILKPQEKWTYSIIEALFDYFKECTGSEAKTYDMFGHSAGGQFVHRYLAVMPTARVGRAVAANPGNYVYPDNHGLFSETGEAADIQTWPYTVKDTPFASDEYLRAWFQRNLVILIGTQDTEPLKSSVLPTDPMRIQGLTRYERAWKFFNRSRDIARKKNMEFNWIIMEVPGAGHSSGQMVFGQERVRSQIINGNERVYNLRDLTNKVAFSIIFER